MQRPLDTLGIARDDGQVGFGQIAWPGPWLFDGEMFGH
jgi:hypothetical protein